MRYNYSNTIVPMIVTINHDTIACYLLFGTSIIIKGVLPLTSTQHSIEDVETPLIEASTSTLEATSSSQPTEAIEESNNPSQTANSQETTNPLSAKEQLKHEIEIAKQNTIAALKVVSSSCVQFKIYVLSVIKLLLSNIYRCNYGC